MRSFRLPPPWPITCCAEAQKSVQDLCKIRPMKNPIFKRIGFWFLYGWIYFGIVAVRLWFRIEMDNMVSQPFELEVSVSSELTWMSEANARCLIAPVQRFVICRFSGPWFYCLRNRMNAIVSHDKAHIPNVICWLLRYHHGQRPFVVKTRLGKRRLSCQVCLG